MRTVRPARRLLLAHRASASFNQSGRSSIGFSRLDDLRRNPAVRYPPFILAGEPAPVVFEYSVEFIVAKRCCGFLTRKNPAFRRGGGRSQKVVHGGFFAAVFCPTRPIAECCSSHTAQRPGTRRPCRTLPFEEIASLLSAGWSAEAGWTKGPSDNTHS